MPQFDFNNNATGTFVTTGASITSTNIVNGVKFTASAPYGAGGSKMISFGNAGSFAFYPIFLNANQSATFTLAFSSTASPSLTAFTGTASSQFGLKLGNSEGGGSSMLGPWQIQFLTKSGGVLADFTGFTGAASLQAIGAVSSIKFTPSVKGGGIVLQHINAKALNCFCACTLIDTPAGKRPVEDLTAGDKILTADGKETTVHWLGQQFVDTKLRHPKMVNPICISAGVLGNGLPERDLFLSQDHAVAIDGTLYNAGALVDGETIYQVAEMPNEGFTYYHVETDAHELLVAEGVAAESYIDYAGRDGFDNAEAGTGREIAEMDLPRVSTARMVPDYLKPRRAA